ncbi:hypothetical protein DOM22_11830 [Bdellovibrio sp. ZAP7]|nr:hypothetical protein DOM22_11830 [Bdellovibrio sp. ZAP7]
MKNSNSSKGQRPTTVRGPALREKIIQSQIEGEEFRTENQGADVRETLVNHSQATTHNRTKSDGKK